MLGSTFREVVEYNLLISMLGRGGGCIFDDGPIYWGAAPINIWGVDYVLALI